MAKMGKIIRNGIEYSGGGGSSANIEYLTQAQYDALSDDKLTNGIEYRITDANTSTTAARNIAYDNSESGIEAVSVQDAIDTVSESLEWKFVGNGTGNNASVTLPNTFREVMVLATPDNTNRYGQTVMFPKMSSNGTLGQSLYWESNSTSSAYIIILIDYSNNKVIIGGSSNATNCYMQVFAR